MTEIELLSLIAAGESETSVLDFDLSPVPRATLADLNTDLIEEYVHSKLGISLDELPVDLTQQLISWKILIEQTNASTICLDWPPPPPRKSICQEVALSSYRAIEIVATGRLGDAG